MVLREPDGVVSGLIHDGKPLERGFVDRIERHGPIAPAEELQNPDFHGFCSRRNVLMHGETGRAQLAR
jgi:hypothetical protein